MFNPDVGRVIDISRVLAPVDVLNSYSAPSDPLPTTYNLLPSAFIADRPNEVDWSPYAFQFTWVENLAAPFAK